MIDSRLEKARQLMKEEADRKNGTNRGTSFGDNASYPFWRIPPTTSATIRLLPDKDETNAWPWVERQVIKLPFAGTVGGDSGSTDKQVLVTVPCIDMFGDACPVIAATKPWWRDDNKKDLARVYWKKRSSIGQGFVVSSPFDEETVPENPVRRFIFGNELVEKLKAGMADPDMEFWPTDYLNGYDFRIRKTVKGEFNNYSTSDWSRKSRPLAEAEMLAIEQHGLFNLADFRGVRPEADGVAAIRAMFQASVAGEPYDFAAFSKYYRPYGVQASTGGTQPDDEGDDFTPTSGGKTKATVALTNGSESTSAPTTGSATMAKSSQELLSKLRDRTPARS